MQRPRLADELAGRAALRAGVGAAVAANERLLELPLAVLEAAPAVRVRALDTLQHGSVGRSACGATCEADGRPYDDERPESAPDPQGHQGLRGTPAQGLAMPGSAGIGGSVKVASGRG